MKRLIFIFLSILIFGATKAQVKYWVFFTDKPLAASQIEDPSRFLSKRAIERRAKQQIAINRTDLPVHIPYLKKLTAEGVVVLQTSRWLNGASVFATNSQIEAIEKLTFVKSIKPVLSIQGQSNEQVEAFPLPITSNTTTATPYSYGSSWNQISMLSGDYLHDDDSRGQGMLIAVLDGGFTGADFYSGFDSLWARNGIIGAYDFNDGDTNVFERGTHGMSVLSVMAAHVDGQLVGSAPEANYLLLQSENQLSETTLEEDNWVSAAEFADSAGADIINSSLGYNNFDNGFGNYDTTDLDGRTGTTSLAAVMAARKGILVINSAGNEGSSNWRKIITPADADSILAVGGVDDFEQHVGFSSVGPSADGRIKPDIGAKAYNVALIMSFGSVGVGNGTSFAAPLITGLSACLWQRHPNATAMQVRQAIMESSHQYNNPDNLLGYGIPDFELADYYLSILSDEESRDLALGEVFLYPNPFSNNVALHVPSTISAKRAHISVSTINGKIVFDQTIDLKGQVTKIPINSNLKNGLYIFQVMIGDEWYTFKMMR